MKRFLKIVTSTVSLLTIAAIPLTASAITIGVSDEIDTSVISGHLNQQSLAQSWTGGTTSSTSSTSKNGTETDNGTTAASVTDPAASAGTTVGQFNVSENTTANTNGTYGSFNQTTSSLTGMEAETGLTNTVSTFANP